MNISNLKFAKQTFKTFNRWLLVICTCSFLLPYNRAVAGLFIPDMVTSSFDLAISHSECKAKAIKVASLSLAKYLSEESNSIFRITGRTSSSRVLLVCMKKNQGVHFVVIAASDGFTNEAKSLRERISKFMRS